MIDYFALDVNGGKHVAGFFNEQFAEEMVRLNK
jgi:hypothetical protein